MDDDSLPESRLSSVAYYALRVLPFGILFLTGISLWGHPEQELLYTFSANQSCLSETCITIYSIELGNTGKTDIPELLIRLSEKAQDDVIIPPSVRKFGKLLMPSELSSLRGGTELRFGPLERGKNVVVSFSTQSQSHNVWSESQILNGIIAGDTPVVRGDPNMTRFGRVITGIVELF